MNKELLDFEKERIESILRPFTDAVESNANGSISHQKKIRAYEYAMRLLSHRISRYEEFIRREETEAKPQGFDLKAFKNHINKTYTKQIEEYLKQSYQSAIAAEKLLDEVNKELELAIAK